MLPGMTPNPSAATSQTRSPIFEPLNAAREEIRLVVIHPSEENNAPIECTLLGASLEDDTDLEYLTLSYAWGDPSVTSPVIVNDVEHQVTTNLKAALQRLRDNGYAMLPIWIDTLCINQADVDEKNVQIKYMPKIFRRSKQTLAWLGDDDEKCNGRAVFQALRLLGQTWQAHYVERVTEFDEAFLAKLLDAVQDRPELDEWRIVTSINDMFRWAWWKRRWVVQEVAHKQAFAPDVRRRYA